MMLSSDDKAKVKSKKAKGQTLVAWRDGRVLLLFFLFPFSFFLASCRRDMQDQPKVIAYRESKFYKDGSRPPVEGTVPRGFLRQDREFYFGKKSGTATTGAMPGAATPSGAANPSAMFPDDVETFPFAVTKEVLDRGQDRYQIYCSSCHGGTGYGDGIVARRGFNKPAPASFHQDKLRQAPVGHFFDVITNGWGAMPSHASQIPVADRWNIIAYIRALQLSQTPPVPPAQPSPNAAAKPGGSGQR
jgi:mono/diheme cytochrome c family protein